MLGTTGAVAAAAGHGHLEIVQKLLEYDASTEGSIATAAAGGYRDSVSLLLHHGAYPNERFVQVQKRNVAALEVIPLVCAVDLEHVAMFHLLLEHGADLFDEGCNSEVAWKECARVAREAGLESMLVLLKENGINVDLES
jgi:ankyrin repeat protein